MQEPTRTDTGSPDYGFASLVLLRTEGGQRRLPLHLALCTAQACRTQGIPFTIRVPRRPGWLLTGTGDTLSGDDADCMALFADDPPAVLRGTPHQPHPADSVLFSVWQDPDWMDDPAGQHQIVPLFHALTIATLAAVDNAGTGGTVSHLAALRHFPESLAALPEPMRRIAAAHDGDPLIARWRGQRIDGRRDAVTVMRAQGRTMQAWAAEQATAETAP